MKPFPTVWFRGNEAGFYIKNQLVRVPLKFGSDDMSLHAIPWLYRYWPITIKDGRLVKITIADGKTTTLDLGREFAKVKYRGIGYDFDRIIAVDGNYLNWTGGNLHPERDPNARATAGEREREVQRQLTRHKNEGGSYFVGPLSDDYVYDSAEQFIARADAALIEEAMLATLHAHDPLLTTDQSIEFNTDISKMLTAWERRLAVDLTVGRAETINIEQHDEWQLGEGVAEGLTNDDMPARNTRLADMDGDYEDDDEVIRVVPTKSVILYEKQPPIATPYATVEQILNHYGWVSPENGHRPTYEGRESKTAWLRTRPVAWAPRTIHVARLPDDPKPYAPSEPLPVREVPCLSSREYLRANKARI
jgi:hypothetical protein